MISGNGWEAVFEHKEGDTRAPVVFFDENGDGWIVGVHGRLRKAADAPGFARFEETDGKVVGMIPGHGYTVVYKKADGSETRWPLLGWIVYESGRVEAVDPECGEASWYPGFTLWSDCSIEAPPLMRDSIARFERSMDAIEGVRQRSGLSVVNESEDPT